jgi:L-histidine Nalpha-methyltransferase
LFHRVSCAKEYIVNKAPVLVDPSQFPEAVQEDLVASLRARQINHKFHYVSYDQAEKWLALHEAYSPARKDPDCKAIYEKAFAAAAKLTLTGVVGLGCGGGQKDARLLAKLARRKVNYTPVDVSLPLVLTARRAALELVPEDRIRPGVVCDLATATELAFEESPKLLTFFGMLPNFEPNDIVPRIAALLGRGDYLLCSANLAPGADYAKGVQKVLPQYKNTLTDDWLMTFLVDLGIPQNAGTVEWSVEPSSGLLRIVANFRFAEDGRVSYANNVFKFIAGETIRLFFSYRYTPYLLEKLLAAQGIRIVQQWITRSAEEGVFLCQRA